MSDEYDATEILRLTQIIKVQQKIIDDLMWLKETKKNLKKKNEDAASPSSIQPST